MKTIEVKLFKFSELSEEAKQTAIENWRNNQNNDDFQFAAESIIDDAKEIGKLLGIDISNIYYSGFYSQGDGACFEGHYRYNTGSIKKLKEYAPENKELHRIADELQALQKKHFYQLMADVRHRGHYYHEMCTDISVYRNDYKEVSSDTEDAVKELLRDYMRWIYSTLDKENDYVNSDEAISETLEVNGYDFTETGELY